MSHEGTHIIKNQILELKVPAKHVVFEVQHDLKAALNSKVMPILERLLDEYAPTKGVLRLEQLEVDLGLLSRHRLEKDIEERIEAALRESIEKVLFSLPGSEDFSRRETPGLTEERAEFLLIFLEQGAFPWWAKGRQAEGLVPDVVLDTVLESYPFDFVSYLEDCPTDAPVWARLWLQFKAAQLQELASLLAGAVSDAIGPFLFQALVLKSSRNIPSDDLFTSVLSVFGHLPSGTMRSILEKVGFPNSLKIRQVAGQFSESLFPSLLALVSGVDGLAAFQHMIDQAGALSDRLRALNVEWGGQNKAGPGSGSEMRELRSGLQILAFQWAFEGSLVGRVDQLIAAEKSYQAFSQDPVDSDSTENVFVASSPEDAGLISFKQHLDAAIEDLDLTDYLQEEGGDHDLGIPLAASDVPDFVLPELGVLPDLIADGGGEILQAEQHAPEPGYEGRNEDQEGQSDMPDNEPEKLDLKDDPLEAWALETGSGQSSVSGAGEDGPQVPFGEGVRGFEFRADAGFFVDEETASTSEAASVSDPESGDETTDTSGNTADVPFGKGVEGFEFDAQSGFRVQRSEPEEVISGKENAVRPEGEENVGVSGQETVAAENPVTGASESLAGPEAEDGYVELRNQSGDADHHADVKHDQIGDASRNAGQKHGEVADAEFGDRKFGGQSDKDTSGGAQDPEAMRNRYLAWQANYRSWLEDAKHKGDSGSGFANWILPGTGTGLNQTADTNDLAAGISSAKSSAQEDASSYSGLGLIPGFRLQSETETPDFYVDNGGLVLIWPFVERYFDHVGLLRDKQFVDNAARERGMHLFQFLASGLSSPDPEFALVLNKILVGLKPKAAVGMDFQLREAERAAGNQLLQTVVQYWSALKGGSPDGLRGSYLLRRGRLYTRQHGWRIQVERKPLDILMKKLPWGLTPIRLPWLDYFIYVDW